MRTLGYLLLACVLLAAMKAALAVLLVVLAIGLVWSAATRPRETAVFFGLLILNGLIHDHGFGFLVVVCVAIIIRVTHRPAFSCDFETTTQPDRSQLS